jgi:signal transduction histidine kinase
MSARTTHLAIGRDGIWALVATVVHGLAAYFVAADFVLWPWGVLLAAASATYVSVGVFSGRVTERVGLPVYLVVQTALGAGIVWFGRGHPVLAPLPVLVVYALTLPRAAVIAAAALHAAHVQACILYFSGAAQIEIVSAVVAGEVFVIAFTELALRERKARELLAEAHAALAAKAEQAEELAVLQERNRLARELHDTLGHYLTVVHVHLQAADKHLDQNRATARDALEKSIRLTHACIEDVRRSVSVLQASTIGVKQLGEAVADLVTEAGAAGMQVRFRLEGEPRPVAPAGELALFRAAQEGLTNVRKHSSAREADVTLTYGESTAEIEVRDPGSGCQNLIPGFGIRGLKERAELLGGELRVAQESGFTLTLRVPLRQGL